MVHKTDWMEYRLSIQPKTGHIWVGKGDMPKEYVGARPALHHPTAKLCSVIRIVSS